MATSRYRSTQLLNNSYYASYQFPDDALQKIPVVVVDTTAHDRLDTLAFKYLGQGEYWWMIAMLNNIEWAFDFVPGTALKIPHDPQDVLDLI